MVKKNQEIKTEKKLVTSKEEKGKPSIDAQGDAKEPKVLVKNKKSEAANVAEEVIKGVKVKKVAKKIKPSETEALPGASESTAVEEKLGESAAKSDKEKPERDIHKAQLTPKKYRHGKKYREIEPLIEKGKEYEIEEAVVILKKTQTTNFDSSVEIHINLGIDPSNADHQIRGSVIMPAGTGKSKKICAIVGPDNDKESKVAGADHVGGQDLVEKIQKGWLDFEVVVATPDMMPQIGKIGKILGTKGLMPNPKTGTVTNDPAKAIQDIKKGKADYKIDKQGSLHSAIGKASFKDEDLIKNIETFLETVRHSKPASLKGTFIKSIYLATSMGPSIKIKK